MGIRDPPFILFSTFFFSVPSYLLVGLANNHPYSLLTLFVATTSYLPTHDSSAFVCIHQPAVLTRYDGIFPASYYSHHICLPRAIGPEMGLLILARYHINILTCFQSIDVTFKIKERPIISKRYEDRSRECCEFSGWRPFLEYTGSGCSPSGEHNSTACTISTQTPSPHTAAIEQETDGGVRVSFPLDMDTANAVKSATG